MSAADEETELYLREKIRVIYEQARAEAAPYVARLVELNARKPTIIYVDGAQSFVLSKGGEKSA